MASLDTIKLVAPDVKAKAFFISQFAAEYFDFENYLSEHSEAIFKRIERLSAPYFLQIQDKESMRCAGIILLSASFIHPDSLKETSFSFLKRLVDSSPDHFYKVSSQIKSCLQGFFNEEHTSDYPTLGDVFYDAAISLHALKNPEERLIIRHSLQSKGEKSPVPHLEWLDRELQQLKEIKFKTFAGQVYFSQKLAKNISELQEIKASLSGSVTAEASEKKILALYRSVSRNLIDMISITDHKAGLLLSANAISLSLLVSFFGRGLTDHPRLWASAILIAGTCALTVLFASLAARPVKRDLSHLPLKELLKTEEGVLHYGNAARLNRDEFIEGFQMMMRDDEMLERGLLAELHFYSVRIVNKLKMVRRAYITMFTGIFLSFVALLLSKYL